MKYRIILLLLFTTLIGVGCYQAGLWPSPTPLPMPTELANTPLPPSSEVGGLDGVYVSRASIDGGQDSRCYKLYRFYPDGLALYSDLACFEEGLSADKWPELDHWFNREDRVVARGDYYLSGSKIFVRIVSYNPIYETVELRTFQGEICEPRMVLQEPTVTKYAGIPSELTQPVLEYAQLIMPGRTLAPSGSASASPAPDKTGETDCHVAGFKILKRPTIVIAGDQAEYQILTEPGEMCSLRYTPPGGGSGKAPGSGTILADSQGWCRWLWELGDQPGEAIVTIGIDEIWQDFSLEVRLIQGD